ncbi:MAG: tRNA (guanosine(37)-N1)-methyltransferase TrmD [Candidatus Nanopelagicales bacterium]
MRLDVITIFPDYLAPLHLSLVGKAIADGRVRLGVHDLREHTHDRHRTVDDSPYGGGPGMVMKPEPWGEALSSLFATAGSPVRLVIPTPSGRRFDQPTAHRWAADPWLIFACGRYEGIDSRVARWAAKQKVAGVPVAVEEVSIGDYVLAGAEAAVLVMVEAVARLLPGVLGNERSHQDDSFAPGEMASLLEGPVFTRPPLWEGLEVPPVLLSGDHGAVDRWRLEQAQSRTRQMRADLVT